MAADDEAAGFWAAARDGRLVVEQCCACGVRRLPPRGVCRVCGSVATALVDASLELRLVSYTVNHQPWFPELEIPTVVALVEPVDHPGVQLLGQLRAPDGTMTIGMALTGRFEPGLDGTPLLLLQPAIAAP